MDKLEPGSLIAIIGGIVGVFTVFFRIIESLVLHLLNERKQKSSTSASPRRRDVQPDKAGYTADLAVQRRALDDLQDDLHQIEQLVRDVKTGLTKDVPYSMSKIDTKLVSAQSDIRELQRGLQDFQQVLSTLRTSLDGNTAATKAFYEMFSKFLHSRDRT